MTLPRFYLGELLWLAALAVGGAQACRGARSPAADDLARYRDALHLARASLGASLALCATRPPSEVEHCAQSLDALSEAVQIGDATLASVETCTQAEREACVRQASETARERLPELLRLLGREGGGS